MNALNHTAERIIAAKTQPRPIRYAIQVEAAKPDGPLEALAVRVTAPSLQIAETLAAEELKNHGYAIFRMVRVLATIAA